MDTANHSDNTSPEVEVNHGIDVAHPHSPTEHTTTQALEGELTREPDLDGTNMALGQGNGPVCPPLAAH